MSIILKLIGSPVLAFLLGPIVMYLLDQMKNGWTWLDKQGPLTKQSAAVVLSFALVGLSHFIPGSVPEACANVAGTGIGSACIVGLTSKDFITTVLTALIAVAAKHGQQNAGK